MVWYVHFCWQHAWPLLCPPWQRSKQQHFAFNIFQCTLQTADNRRRYVGLVSKITPKLGTNSAFSDLNQTWSNGVLVHIATKCNIPRVFGSNELPKYAQLCKLQGTLFALKLACRARKWLAGLTSTLFFRFCELVLQKASVACNSSTLSYRIPAWLQLFPMQSGSISTILLPECMRANYKHCQVFIDVHRFESNSRISKSSNHFHIVRLCAERNCFLHFCTFESSSKVFLDLHRISIPPLAWTS